ncbi:MAG: peptide deformylase [Kosmotoga sp.]|nr:MAG: peptide deformylase [Kosmotoga sp.]
MTIRTLGDPILREKSEKVTKFDENLHTFIKKLTEIMYKEDGVGLSAVQVGILKRVFVFDGGVGSKVIINPEIIETSAEMTEIEEGCLSIPDVYANVVRPKWVRMVYQDETGESHEEIFDNYSGRIVQHESDHLNGVLFIDRISNAKKILLKPKLSAIMRKSAT